MHCVRAWERIGPVTVGKVLLDPLIEGTGVYVSVHVCRYARRSTYGLNYGQRDGVGTCKCMISSPPKGGGCGTRYRRG